MVSGHTPWRAVKHKSPSRPAPIEFSCSPWATLPVDGHADAMDRILDALEADLRALGPVVGYDDGVCRVDAIFQVDAGGFNDAVEAAAAIFDDALRAADVDARTVGVTVVVGGPEELP